MDLLNEANRQVADNSEKRERRRVRGLWIGFIVWVLILLNAIRIGPSIIANGFPLPIFVVGILVDLVIAVVTLVFLRKTYRKLRIKDESHNQAGRRNLSG